MGQIEYFGHTFGWRTHKRSAGAFEAIAEADGAESVVGLYPNRSAAYRAAKAGAMARLETWRTVIIFEAMRKRHERKFKRFARNQLAEALDPMRRDRSPVKMWERRFGAARQFADLDKVYG